MNALRDLSYQFLLMVHQAWSLESIVVYIKVTHFHLFFFYIVMEGLSVLFKRASNSSLFKGINCGNGMHLIHLQYTNDTLVLVLMASI